MKSGKEQIALHHIGAAGMTHPFSNRSAFLSDFAVYMYDANPDILTGSIPKEWHIIPRYVGSKKERRPFYITYDPSSSSLLKFNPEYEQWYINHYIDSFFFDTGSKVVAEEELDVVPLDDAIEEFNAAMPDILSIDAEGMSYDILLGAEKSLENTVAVICEVEFDEIRLGQKTFYDIGNHLKDTYHFAGFTGQQWRFSPHRAPLGFRGLGLPFSWDALFFAEKGNYSR